MKTLIRTAGIWIADEQILLESLADKEVWGIPGGGLEDGETVEQGCIREYREETGLDMVCRRLAIVHEYFGTEVLEYGFYFTVEPRDRGIHAPLRVTSLESQLKFEWFSLSDILTLRFVPRALQSHLLHLGTETMFLSTIE